jgi:hypothetical protein
MAAEFASVMAGAASAHQAATASREGNGQQRAGRARRSSGDPQRAQQGATAAAADAPAALQTLSRLQHLADDSPQVAQLRRLQALAAGRSAPVAQLASGPEEGELVQVKFATAQLQPQLQQAPRANNTGLPDQLKSGIESLSGLSLDHVRVHYNSAQPAQLNALAYAQGSDIHLAPGQEQHLPHEAWHVVQQAQGRVRPTLQLKDGVPVNDDVGLEREADVMGSKALEGGHRVVEAHRSVSMPIETAQPIDGDAMNSPEVNVASNHSAPLANGRGSAQRGGNEMQRIADQRPDAALQRQVQVWGDGSERVGQLRALQGVADGRGSKRQDLTPGLRRKSDTSGNDFSDRQISGNSDHSGMDSRPAAVLQKKLSEAANGGPQVKSFGTLQAMANRNTSTRKTFQLKASLDANTGEPIQRITKEEAAEEAAATRLQAIFRGWAVRKQVSVRSLAPGIISTEINPSTGQQPLVAPFDSPLAKIQGLIQPGATYNRLRVVKGALQGGVFGTGNGGLPVSPDVLAKQAPSTTAVINGGYFVHKAGLETDRGEVIDGIGRPVGPTSTRDDHTPIADPWQQYYGQVTVGGNVGVSSGPLLALNGAKQALPDDNRFKYRVDGIENHLNKRAGALTHASDANERAAISIDNQDDVIMHTLTAKGARHLGVNMEKWQALTTLGSNPHDKTYASTLNLDGGGSVFMGIRLPYGVETVSRGGQPDDEIRPVANIIASRPR